MRDSQSLLQTITRIYAAPGSRAHWNDSIGSICSLLGGIEGAYLLVNAEDHRTESMATSGYSEEHIQRYMGYGGAITDVRQKYIDRMIPGQVYREFEYVPDRTEYDNSKWIQYQLATTGTYWSMTAHISKHGLWHDFATVNRLKSLGPHTDEQKADFQELLPHLARAAELERAVNRLEEQYGAVLGVLDMFLVGLVILDKNRRVAVANRAAREICDCTGALSLAADGRLTLPQARRDVELQALICQTTQTANTEGDSSGGSMVVAKRSGIGCVLVEVTPLNDAGISDGDGLCGSAVFILDANRSNAVSVSGLSKIFELTPTEHEVATSLINGGTPASIADQRGRALDTIRCHIKNIFAKTGARSQLELLRLATKADPPIVRR